MTELWYLVGIKGVAMASLAQILVEAGKTVQGCDVAEDFVTAGVLAPLKLQIEVGFDHPLPAHVATLVYTSAHQGQFNPMVQQARQLGIPTLSQAEALAQFHNQKKGLAVCGVGGKSTTSAMITWIMEKVGWEPSYSVGVGNIPGLNHTGRWRANSPWFVTEADEYVIDASAPSRGEPITPRFSFLIPLVTVCTNLNYDHPDVYRDFAHTEEVFAQFFSQIQPGGWLVVNQDSVGLKNVLAKVAPILVEKKISLVSFGETAEADWQLTNYQAVQGKTTATLHHESETFTLSLPIPGKFNLMNGVAAVAACVSLGMPAEAAVAALADFPSTLRRFQLVGTKNGVTYYDDYGHHPNEVYQAIQALNDWYPTARKIIAFQSHTFSRTKQLFAEFVAAFREAQTVVMIDIFPSAREAFDSSVTSDGLCAAIQQAHPQVTATNLKTIPALAEYFRKNLQPGDVCLTMGAGDIYQVHELV